MIQGFCTKLVTDEIIQPFVESAHGVMHACQEEVDELSIANWPSFKLSDLNKMPIAVFGILRGTGDLIKHCEAVNHTYYHVDHAYSFRSQNHHANAVFNQRIYRITKNGLMLNHIEQLDQDDYKRIEKYHPFYEIKPWRRVGKHILVLPPSHHVKAWYGIPQWEEQVVSRLKQFTDREIILKHKEDTRSFQDLLQNAWAVVTCQSAAAVDAVLEGVPSFCDPMSMAQAVSKTDLAQIENPFYPDNRREWFSSLLANQYLMSEIREGVAWRRLKNK